MIFPMFQLLGDLRELCHASVYHAKNVIIPKQTVVVQSKMLQATSTGIIGIIVESRVLRKDSRCFVNIAGCSRSFILFSEQTKSDSQILPKHRGYVSLWGKNRPRC